MNDNEIMSKLLNIQESLNTAMLAMYGDDMEDGSVLQEGLDFSKMRDAMHSHFNPEKLRQSLDPAKLKAAMQKAGMTDVGAFIKMAVQKGFIEKLKK